MIRRLILLSLMTCLLALLGASCGDEKPNDPVNPLPNIKTFIFSPGSILILDSSTLVWNVQHADSMLILPTGEVVKPVDSGKTTVLPDSSLVYTAIAYNQYGSDTVVADLNVTIVPFRVLPKFSSYFKGTYGSGVLDPPLDFVVSDSTGRALADTMVYFSIVTGDGTLLTDSALTDANGEVTAAYEFTGNETEAKLRARFSNVDSSEVWLRVNTLRFKTGGQVQYIMFDDHYGDILNYLGAPDTIVDQGVGDFAAIAEYDSSLGVVFILYDHDDDGVIQETASVLGAAIVDSIFPQEGGGKSARFVGTDSFSIGIGSDYVAEISATYGSPSFPLKIDYTPGAVPESSVIAAYDTLMAWFWLWNDTSEAFEIDMFEFAPGAPTPAKVSASELSQMLKSYRLSRMSEKIPD
ncbi:MAG: hypothetical protein P1R58_05050 [bacterium]|nr:hypothetical protein [bacterium]